MHEPSVTRELVPTHHPRLLVVAHGTASVAGTATTESFVDAVRVQRPSVDVDLCYLDVVAPRLADVLDDRPTVVVPLLLSTGFHVQSDIPEAVAPHRQVRVARHLGPDPLVVDALMERMGVDPHGVLADSTVLVAAGSSRPEAVEECLTAALAIQRRMCRLVPDHRISVATMTDDLDAVLAAQTEPFQVATYLLADGAFTAKLRRAANGRGTVAPPLGVHPLLVQLVWQRYDEVLGTR